MPPKRGGHAGGGKASAKKFNENVKAELLEILNAPWDKTACPRCAGYKHTHILDCWEDFKSQQHWSVGQWKFEDKEKQKLEAFFKEQQKEFVDAGKFIPKFKANPPDPRAKQASMQPPPNAFSKSQASSQQPAVAASGAPTPAPVKKRTPIATAGVGTDLPRDTPIKAGARLDLPKNGAPSVKTTSVGAAGSQGTFKVITNYVGLLEVPDKLHVYSLTFWRPSDNPQSTSGRVQLTKRREIQMAFEAIKKADSLKLKADNTVWATDCKDLWCTTALSGPAKDTKSWDTPVVSCKLLDGKEYGGVYVSVASSGVLDNIRAHLTQDSITDLSDHIRALNAFVARRVMFHSEHGGKPVTQLGANKFYLNEGFTDMTDKQGKLGLRAVRGYYTSVRPGSHGALLNVNVATTAFLEPCLVSNMLGSRGNSLNDTESMLRGARVMITYKRQDFKEMNDQGYSINDQLPRTKVFQQFGDHASRQRFFQVLQADKNDPNSLRSIHDNDRGTTVQKYFQDMGVQFPVDAKDHDLQCVNVGKRVKSLGRPANEDEMKSQTLAGAQWIPAILLEILPYQPMSGQMNPRHTAEMIKHALHLPAENAALINQEGLDILGVKATLPAVVGGSQTDLGVKLDGTLTSVPARTLRLPQLLYEKPRGNISSAQTEDDHPNTKVGVMPNVNKASWDLKTAAFTRPIHVQKLNVLGLDGWTYGKLLPGAERTKLETIAKDFAIQLCRHHVYAKADYWQAQVHQDLLESLKDFFGVSTESDCTLVLLKEKSFATYANIKRFADFSGKHTICAIENKIKSLGNDKFGFGAQLFSNLSLKLNMKMGGDNHWMDAADFDRCLGGSQKKNLTMIMGSDVTHPGAGSKIGTPSIACVVGTIDNRFMSYRGSMRLQAGGQEQIENDNLRSMIKERLNAWKAKNGGKLPETILWYRDGVSESQFTSTETSEIPQIRQAYTELGGAIDKLKIGFIIVSKRHHTRFYAANKQQTYQFTEKRYDQHNNEYKVSLDNGNLRPGLLVNDVVTAPNPTNFFLQSHSAIKGTARSAHYYVLKNETAITQTQLQDLSLMLCYTFGRSTTGVSYAAPAYIADRLCERGRAYLRPWTDNKWMSPLFEYTKYTDGQGKQRKSTDAEMLADKKRMVVALLRNEEIWGSNYNDGHDPRVDRPVRLNPWHGNLDVGMFWM